ncbi:MAG: hypothetical protein KAX88_05125 [Rhodoferax sp.]|jgi:hypothetical protein|nr:hypothetical protein [Rhodoferax sp.]
MHTRTLKSIALAAILSVLPCSMVLAQGSGSTTPAPESATSAKVDRVLNEEPNWYFSWGYSRQRYAPSDIHVSQPGLGNDFTVHQAAGSDFPATAQQTIEALGNFEFTLPQENVRVGKFLNPEKTFAIEFSLDHSKYQTDLGQVAQVSGMVNRQPYNANMVLDANNFFYALHNGLNHLMINAVWLHHLAGPEKQAGDLQLISRAGAGILLPHADNTVFGKQNEVGPKNENICCFASNDWWQVNGWTAGVEVGVRYRVYKSVYLELTQKLAYGALRKVPVYQGFADQTLWMSEQVLSAGFLF